QKKVGDRTRKAIAALVHDYFANRMSSEVVATRADGVNLSFDLDGEVPWIRADNLFVAIVSKDEAPNKLLDRLCDALAASKPSALQVLMVHARAALEKAGSQHDFAVLHSRERQAGWLYNVFSAPPADRGKRVAELYGHLFRSLA